tara:strand:- start:227 stop:628 length:402 start_codon:yes stop_codon:yes gene_type:complete
MLGGGNPVSSANPTGIGQTLIYIGKHAYATSGSIALTAGQSSAVDTMLKFTTGNSYVVGKLDISDTSTAGQLMLLDMTYDGQSVIVNNSESHDAASPLRFDILIPPFTLVELKMGTDGSGLNASAFITGEVYA